MKGLPVGVSIGEDWGCDILKDAHLPSAEAKYRNRCQSLAGCQRVGLGTGKSRLSTNKSTSK